MCFIIVSGKKTIARAIAKEKKLCFILISGYEIVSQIDDRYASTPKSILRAKFEEAGKKSNAMIYIDQIDEIAPKRDGYALEWERSIIVCQLKTLMNKIQKGSSIIVMAGAFCKYSVDWHLLEKDFFNDEINIGDPNEEDRSKILKIHTKNKQCDSVDFKIIATKTNGYNGIEIKKLCSAVATNNSKNAEVSLTTDNFLCELKKRSPSTASSKSASTNKNNQGDISTEKENLMEFLQRHFKECSKCCILLGKKIFRDYNSL